MPRRHVAFASGVAGAIIGLGATSLLLWDNPKTPEWITAIGTAALGVVTLALAVVGISQIRVVAQQQRKWTTLQACDRYDSDPVLNAARDVLWRRTHGENVPAPDLKNELSRLFDKVSIINFNYDRCVEHFLMHAVSAKYSVPLKSAHDLVSELQILHPYGSIGPLPGVLREGVAFGEESGHPEFLLNLAQGIRTYTEQIERPEIVKTIGAYLAEAETLVFLGFGYHRQNVDLLTPQSEADPKRHTVKIFGTAMGLSDADRTIIEGKLGLIGHSLSNQPMITLRNDLGCREFLDQYRRSLAID